MLAREGQDLAHQLAPAARGGCTLVIALRGTVDVEADDGVQATQQALTVNVTDTNDTAPDVTSDGGGASASINVAEGSTAVTTVVATDAANNPSAPAADVRARDGRSRDRDGR